VTSPSQTDGADLAYGVRMSAADASWRVDIVDPDGRVVGGRSCPDAAEARTYASTVRQHLYWLSPARFRRYYGIAEPA
jgi:hypothetical protein